MTKLTTERLEEIAKLEITEFSNGMDIAKDAYQSVGSSEIVLMARQLLAYEQAAEHPAARITWDGSEFSVSNVSEDFLYGGTAVYLAPVLPKQPEQCEVSQKRLEVIGYGSVPASISEQRSMARALLSAQPVSEPYKLEIDMDDADHFSITHLHEIIYGKELIWPEAKLLARFMLDVKQRASAAPAQESE